MSPRLEVRDLPTRFYSDGACIHAVNGLSFALDVTAEVRQRQRLSARMVDVVRKYRPLPALKARMKFAGVDCGPARVPLKPMTADEIAALRRDLDQPGFRARLH